MRKAGVLTISDGCAKGEREDISGPVLAQALEAAGWNVAFRAVVPDELHMIADTLTAWCAEGCHAILTTGGTGFAPRDITPEATRQVIERDAPGLAELLRWTGYQKLPRAVLSRGIAGIRGTTVIVNLPGSVGGVRDGLEVLLPLLPHAVALLLDEPTDHTPAPSSALSPDTPPDTIAVLQANLDDLSPEFYEPLMERLFSAGALDVALSPLQMKKNRPGVLLTVLAPVSLREACTQIIFEETTTFGIRHSVMERSVLQRRVETVATPYGTIRVKMGTWQGVETTAAPEYEDVKAAAAAHHVPVKTVYQATLHALTTSRTV